MGRERGWVLSRIAEKPDLTLRALLEQLADRARWRAITRFGVFLTHEGMTVGTIG